MAGDGSPNSSFVAGVGRMGGLAYHSSLHVIATSALNLHIPAPLHTVSVRQSTTQMFRTT